MTDSEEIRKAIVACEDCGLPYADFPLDVVMPDADWLAIHPTGEGGVLCAGCIAKRASKIQTNIVVYARLVLDADHESFVRLKNVSLRSLVGSLNRDRSEIARILRDEIAELRERCRDYSAVLSDLSSNLSHSEAARIAAEQERDRLMEELRLVVVGALVAAEIDRLQRLEAVSPSAREAGSADAVLTSQTGKSK